MGVTTLQPIKLAPILQDGYVAQRGRTLPVWGIADTSYDGGSIAMTIQFGATNEAGENVLLSTISTTTELSADGSFLFEIDPAEYLNDTQPQYARYTVFYENIPYDTQTSATINEVLFGEVWFACGQSNMEFRLRYDQDWAAIRELPVNPNIRMYNVPQLAFPGHQKDTSGCGQWIGMGDDGFDWFSAPGFAFAKDLTEALNCPVGIISCNWGGSSAVAWLPEEDLLDEPLAVYLREYEHACSLYSAEEMEKLSLEGWAWEDDPSHYANFEPLLYGLDRAAQLEFMRVHDGEPVIPVGPYHINRPGGLYEQMLAPIIAFPAQGVIWYQGESDAGKSEIYDQLMAKVIENFRRYQEPDMAFLQVQLAPFGIWLACDNKGYAATRAAQERVTKQVPNTGLVSIMDIGSYYDIHPKAKQEVGRRLSLLARGMIYGEQLLHKSPHIEDATVCLDNGTIVLTFSDAEGLSSDGKTSDFAIFQYDGKRDITSVNIQDNQIVLQVSNLSKGSITVSLADADYAEVHIQNKAGLPIMPFSYTIS